MDFVMEYFICNLVQVNSDKLTANKPPYKSYYLVYYINQDGIVWFIRSSKHTNSENLAINNFWKSCSMCVC